MTLSGYVTVSVNVSKVSYSDFIFVDSVLKVSGAYYRAVLL